MSIYFIRKLRGKEILFFIEKDFCVIKQGFVITVKNWIFPKWKKEN